MSAVIARVNTGTLTVQVIRAHGCGVFSVEYQGRADGRNRVQLRLVVETMQDDFDDEGEPVRVYIAKDGVPIEAAYCLRGARD